MTTNQSTILIPVDVSTDDRPSGAILELLHPADIVLVGWYPVPDQTAPEQMRDEYEADAIERIEAIADDLPHASGAIETLVVFTRDRADTVDRVADEYDCDAVLVARDVGAVDRVFVPIRGDLNLDAILSFAGVLLEESQAAITLFHASPAGEEDPSAGDLLLQGAEDRLLEAGIDAARIDTVNVSTENPVDEIVAAGEEADVLIIGETEPSLVERILGDVPSRIIERSSRPVLVVRKVE